VHAAGVDAILECGGGALARLRMMRQLERVNAFRFGNT